MRPDSRICPDILNGMIMLRQKKSFALLEIVISLILLVMIGELPLEGLVHISFLTSYAKHKVQAAYVAQRILEEQRRVPFPNLASQPSTPVTIDTMGTFNNPADDFLGNLIITVNNIDADRKRVRVEINWNEPTFGASWAGREYYTTDIANENQLN